jgi:methionine aminopeptidase
MNYIEARHTHLSRASGAVKLHGPEGFAGMRKAGQLAAQCLDMLADHVRPGVRTDTLDRLANDFVVDHGGIPATVFYRGYRYSSCISINEVVCHGMPSERELRDGDILNIDVTAIVDGWHGDTSRMYLCGDVPLKARRLVDVTYDAMMRGLSVIKPGNKTGDLGRAIQAYAERQNANGGDGGTGRKLADILAAAGFVDARLHARFEVYDPIGAITEVMAVQFERDGMPEHARTMRELEADPQGMWAQAWVSCTAVKGGR